MVVGTPVMPVEDGSPHAPGAIEMKGVLTESPANWCILVQRTCVLSGAKRLTGCYCVVARRFYSFYGHMN